ncbi:hypothetical protein BD779DRAFT_1674602 [Infundibulicybe gibba]|nr:hypothetical protein BD779DRAFT_1674602 [Infundibulicybe gibba]
MSEPSLNVMISNQCGQPQTRLSVNAKIPDSCHWKVRSGKSTLINAVFNVDLANVSHDRAGILSIEQEIISPHNDRFVLHDSQGFAPGEVANFNVVRNFIQRRANLPDVKDRLHAIWFCLEIPATNGLLEMGTSISISSISC